MNLANIKNLFLKVLIGCLVSAAGLAVVTVLVGDFNDLLGMALLTILMVAIHSLVSFGFIVNNEKQSTFEWLSLFANAVFFIIVLSFITSIAGIWELLPGEWVWKLYSCYFVLLFAILHAEILAKTLAKERHIDTIVYANFAFMIVVVIMLLALIMGANEVEFGSFYYRLLAAAGIIDATLTLVAIILHKLYMQKHPAVPDSVFSSGQVAQGQASQPAPRHRSAMNIFVIILVGYVVLQFVGSLLFVVVGTFWMR